MVAVKWVEVFQCPWIGRKRGFSGAKHGPDVRNAQRAAAAAAEAGLEFLLAAAMLVNVFAHLCKGGVETNAPIDRHGVILRNQERGERRVTNRQSSFRQFH